MSLRAIIHDIHKINSNSSIRARDSQGHHCYVDVRTCKITMKSDQDQQLFIETSTLR